MMIGSIAGVEFGAALTGAGARLQAALVVHGKIVGNSTLSAVKVDGAPGTKTAAAASLAFSKYVSGAPAAYKKLTTTRVKTTAATLAGLIEAEIRKRGGQVASPATVAASQVTKRVATKTSAKTLAKIKAVAKKTKATQKLVTAKAKIITAKGNAAAMRAIAARARVKARTASAAEAKLAAESAARMERMAAEQEQIAATAARDAGLATQEATQAAVAERAITQSIATDTAQAVAEQMPPPPPPPPPSAAAMIPEAMPSMPSAAPTAEIPGAPSVPSAPSEEGFFARNKLLIGIGALAAAGVAVVVIKKKKGPR